MASAPLPPLTFSGGPGGNPVAEGGFLDGTNFLEGDGWTYDAAFNVGGSGAFASASGEASVWKWLVVAGAAFLVIRAVVKG